MKKAFLHKCYAIALWGVVLTFAFSGHALANGNSTEVDQVLENVVASSSGLPFFISAAAYMLGLILAVTGIIKLKEHVEQPTQVKLSVPVARLLFGGALFALPIVYEAMYTAFNPGAAVAFEPDGIPGDNIMSFVGGILPLPDLNAVLKSLRGALEDIPGFIAAGTYLLGLLFGVTGILKLKEHVEQPEQNQLREGVIRLLVGGAMFAMPSIYQAVYQAFGPGGGTARWTALLLTTPISGYDGDFASACNPVGMKVGNLLCGAFAHSFLFPLFLQAISYLLGLVLAVWGVLKIKAHVGDPRQTGLHEGMMRLRAAGAFFAMPSLAMVMASSLSNPVLMIFGNVPITGYGVTGYASEAAAGGNCEGLDGVVYCFMSDLTQPVHTVLNFFSICAGLIFIMIGISRLIKSAQDGPRGPGGMGTIATFIAGGALLSYNDLMRAATGTFFTVPITFTNSTLRYAGGMQPEEIAQAEIVINAIIKFLILVGLISFVRGIFIIRSVAEGNSQQASIMAGITHMVGGALAVNMGPLINAVQNTLGFTDIGIQFS
jgi:hypothetical protein